MGHGIPMANPRFTVYSDKKKKTLALWSTVSGDSSQSSPLQLAWLWKSQQMSLSLFPLLYPGGANPSPRELL